MKLVILSVILLVHSIYSSPTPQNIDIGAVPNQVGQFIAQVPNQVANFVSQVPNQVSNFVSQAPNQFGNFVSQFSNLIQRPPQWNIFQPQNQMQTIPQVQTIQVQPSEWPQIIQVPFRQSANNNNNNNGNGNGWFFPNFIPNWFNVPLFQNQVGHDPTTIVIIARPKPQGASTTTEAVPVSSTSESTSETTSTVSTSETTPVTEAFPHNSTTLSTNSTSEASADLGLTIINEVKNSTVIPSNSNSTDSVAIENNK